jgi:DNA replication protein DnaC
MESTVLPSSTTPPCPACGGTGFALVEKLGENVARLCACRKAALSSRSASELIETARIPRRYRGCDLEGFGDVGPDAISLSNAKALAARFIDEYPLSVQGLNFMGPPGVGKTHLAVAILRRVISKGFSGMFYDTQDLLRQIQSTFDRGSDASQDEVLSPALACDLLVLDDLGARQATPWVEDLLAHIVTSRYNDRKQVIITTNYLDERRKDRDELLEERIGSRIRSKLLEMCRNVLIQANDFRAQVSSTNPRIRTDLRSRNAP